MTGKRPFPHGVVLRVLAGVALVLLSGAAGLWLGGHSASREFARTAPSTLLPRPAPAAPPEAVESNQPATPPRLFFCAVPPPGADLSIVADEIGMAAAAGVHCHILGVTAPWDDQACDARERLQMAAEADPDGRILLHVNLNPPASWLAAHPDDAVQVNGKTEAYPCVASPVWRDAAANAIRGVVQLVNEAPEGKRVVGYVLACMEEGRWYRTSGYDRSAANAAGFREWLKSRYADDAALQQAWGEAEAALDTAGVPEDPECDNTQRVFFAAMPKYADFLRYLSETTADAIRTLAALLKEQTGAGAQVLAPYGYSFELLNNDAGHFALQQLMDSGVDGFVGPVSYVDRGIGGVGGPTTPINSILAHDKQWLLLDDTRTGIAKDETAGTVKRMKGLHTEDVFSVQLRNFAMAAVNDTGLCWTDPAGEGWLHDEALWTRFLSLREVRERIRASDVPPHGQDTCAATTVAVVVDEASRFFQQCDRPLNALLLNQARDCALRTGVQTKFYLLRDVIEDKVPASPVYLFVNAFYLPEADRLRLHERLAKEKAVAIWLYAPGYLTPEASVENISATTGMDVRAFEKPAEAGSKFTLAGRWMDAGDEFGAQGVWNPLCYIAAESSEVIAKYKASGKASASIRFIKDSWTSVYIADPGISTNLLREILTILDKPILASDTPAKYEDTFHIGPTFFAVHASKAGERNFELSQRYDVQDLLNPEAGWADKQTFGVTLKAGETRLFSLNRIEVQEEGPPADPD